jgi:type IV pilus assembly protein PilV
MMLSSLQYSSQRSKAAQQSGASLIEVLVAVLILSFGMLGMSALQARALKGNQSALQRSQAAMLNYYIMDAMRVDRESAKGGAYNINYVCSSAGITGTGLANDNLRHWLEAAETNLGQTSASTVCGFISCDASYKCTVRIRWDDSKATGNADSTTTTAEVEHVSIL